MSFWRCYYHVVWATNNREPLISSEIETVLVQSTMEKSQTLGSSVEAINTVSDYVHLAVCIPPKIAVAEWIRNIKGIAAHETNETFPDYNLGFVGSEVTAY